MKNININMFDHYSSKRNDLLDEIQNSKISKNTLLIETYQTL